MPLLVPPSLNDGVYLAYLTPSNESMYYVHMKETTEGIKTNSYWLNGEESPDFKETDCQYMGVYASKTDLVEDWPEYRI